MTFATCRTLIIGTPTNFANAFVGSLSNVAVYDEALSESRIQAHYASRNAGLGDSTGERIERICSYAGIPSSMM